MNFVPQMLKIRSEFVSTFSTTAGQYRRPSTTVGVRKLEWLPPLVRYQNIRSALFGFATKHACVRRTDRQTDRQNYDS